MAETPYIGFGNDELARMPKVTAGDFITCAKCGGAHVLEDSDPPMLLFYKCGDRPYLGGIDGRLTAGVKPSVSGSVDLSALAPQEEENG